MTEYKRNKIAPISVFFLLFISRIIVSLTNAQSVTSGLIKTDILISIIIAMGINLILSIPALLCYQKNKSPFDIKWVSYFYAIYFIFLAGVNISRFSYFASTVLNPESPAWIFSLIIAVCIAYASRLGIESIARFSAFAFILVFITIIAGLGSNIENYDDINLYPVITNSTEHIIKNILYITSSSTEVVILLCIGKRVNGEATKPYVFSVLASFLTTFILMLFVNAVMGDAASLNAFPIYTLFQLSHIGLFGRIDMLHISLWIFGVFLKSVLLTYCASTSIKKYKNDYKCIAFSSLSFIVSIVFTEVMDLARVSPMPFVIPYIVSCVIIPLLCLMLKKKNFGDELIEKF